MLITTLPPDYSVVPCVLLLLQKLRVLNKEHITQDHTILNITGYLEGVKNLLKIALAAKDAGSASSFGSPSKMGSSGGAPAKVSRARQLLEGVAKLGQHVKAQVNRARRSSSGDNVAEGSGNVEGGSNTADGV